ncbi:cupin domain-containing protein [Phreatobacter sp.]|uniref:cupin domain-containing protein n=1 Tax=Phreatobacter sp. TaxID=1966341 RepID=UPI0022C25790|nr:cupin domain-containing protein [Phreatobacter sp.]MCZ8315329.1 cupin domain-containing protein [Phreatobacter sp.]
MTRPPFSAESLAHLDLDPAPIRPEWVIGGNPVARCRHWSDSSDGTTSAMVWDCTAGSFRWYFGGDEIVHIIEGEVIVSGDGAAPRTLRPGDAALFRAGTWSTWHVPHYVRKHAICRDSLPALVTLPLRAARKAGRIVERLRQILPARTPAYAMRAGVPLVGIGLLGAIGVLGF